MIPPSESRTSDIAKSPASRDGREAFERSSKTVTTSPAEAKLRRLLVEVLLISDAEYRDDFGPMEIETWDSLAVVTIASAVHRDFGYLMTPEEMVSLESIGDLKELLRNRGHALP